MDFTAVATAPITQGELMQYKSGDRQIYHDRQRAYLLATNLQIESEENGAYLARPDALRQAWRVVNPNPKPKKKRKKPNPKPEPSPKKKHKRKRRKGK